MRRLWVVECNFEEWFRDRWKPTTLSGLTRDEARAEALYFKNRNDGVRTRVRCYEPVEDDDA